MVGGLIQDRGCQENGNMAEREVSGSKKKSTVQITKCIHTQMQTPVVRLNGLNSIQPLDGLSAQPFELVHN